MRLIPAIDLRGGRCVRLRQGDFNAETSFAIQPAELLDRFVAWGADWVHVVDLDAARDGSSVNRTVIETLVARTNVRLQVGGGLRTRTDVSRMLDCGVLRAVIGSLAVTAPDASLALIDEFGADRIALALDVRADSLGTPRLATHGWREQTTVSLWEALDRFPRPALKHVLCTDVARDGMLGGPNLELYAEALRRHPGIEWQASGGIRDRSDLDALAQLGLAAAVSGRALLEGLIEPQELRPFLPNA
jgi:phosphoribosylformimino-5-aminoimidazole carboxamide ribotide isomerase